MDNNQYPGQQGNPNQSYPQPNQQFGQGYPQQPNQQYNQGYNQQYNQGYQQPLYNQPPQKNNTNRTVLIIILIVIGVFILLSVIIGVGIYMAIERESATENDTSITFEEYTISNTTEATTEATTSSIIEDTEDETTEETTEESTGNSSTAAEADYPGKYTPDYEVERKGDSTTGYIDVPASWLTWTEAGATWDNVIGHQQYAYGMLDVITHVTYDESMFALDLETTLNNMASSEAESKVESARFGDYEGYLMTEKFNDGVTLRIFMFNDGKGHVQYLAVEGIDDDYADVYKLVFQNFSFDD